MTCGTIRPDFVRMVSRRIVSMMAGRGVTGLAYAVPWCITLKECKVVRPLLENRKVKSTFNVPCLVPYELQVDCFYPRVRVHNHVRPVGVVT